MVVEMYGRKNKVEKIGAESATQWVVCCKIKSESGH